MRHTLKLMAVSDAADIVRGIWISRDNEPIEFACDDTSLTSWQSDWLVSPYTHQDGDISQVYEAFWEICREFGFHMGDPALLRQCLRELGADLER